MKFNQFIYSLKQPDEERENKIKDILKDKMFVHLFIILKSTHTHAHTNMEQTLLIRMVYVVGSSSSAPLSSSLFFSSPKNPILFYNILCADVIHFFFSTIPQPTGREWSFNEFLFGDFSCLFPGKNHTIFSYPIKRDLIFWIKNLN